MGECAGDVLRSLGLSPKLTNKFEKYTFWPIGSCSPLQAAARRRQRGGSSGSQSGWTADCVRSEPLSAPVEPSHE